MNIRLAALLIAALPLVGAAPSGNKDPLAGRVMGKPQSCMDDIPADLGPTIVDDHTITYSRTGRRIWMVHPDGFCPALRPFTTLIVEKYGTQSCAGDRFRVLEPGNIIPSAYCRFGKFTPYDRPQR